MGLSSPAATRAPPAASASARPLLSFQSVGLHFGAAEILRDIDLTINEGDSSASSGRRAAARLRCYG